MKLYWSREGYARHVEPPTYILTTSPAGAGGDLYAKVVLDGDAWFWFATGGAKGRVKIADDAMTLAKFAVELQPEPKRLN